MDILLHSANVLYLFSFLMRDILWLRVLTVIAASLLIAFFWFRPDPLLGAIAWNLVFTALNIYWITRLILERRPVALTEAQQRLHQLAFRALKPREMLELLKLALWEEHDARTCFVRQGTALDRLIVIFSGRACVQYGGKDVAEIGQGQFIGGMSYITDGKVAADVYALEPTCCVTWPKARLRKFLRDRPELRAAFQSILGAKLTTLLQESWARQPNASAG